MDILEPTLGNLIRAEIPAAPKRQKAPAPGPGPFDREAVHRVTACHRVPCTSQVAFAMEKGSMVELPPLGSVFGAQVAGCSGCSHFESEADLGPGQGHGRLGLGCESRTWPGCGLGPSVAQGTVILMGYSTIGRAAGRFGGVLRGRRAAPGRRVLRKPGVWESRVLQVQCHDTLTGCGQEEFGVVHSGDNLTGALLQTRSPVSG